MPKQRLYLDDLVHVHIEGYGFHWERAAPAILGWLQERRISNGLILDLGCGGGQWLERLVKEGYEVCGVDLSKSMIRAAKQRVPAGRLIHGSFAEVELPVCDAVTSLGEPINYLDGARSIKRVFRKVFNALNPGGVFIFDAREPAAGSIEPRTVARVGDDWACIATIREDGGSNTIIRKITTFRRTGKSYRRSEEVHRLKVYPRKEIARGLRELGFRVRFYRGYSDYRLSPRQFVVLARKPK